MEDTKEPKKSDSSLSEAGKRLRAAHRPARQATARVPKPKLGMPKDRLAVIEDAAERLLNGEISGAAFKALVAGITKLGKDKTIQAMKPPRVGVPEFARPKKPAEPLDPPVEVVAAPLAVPVPERGRPSWFRCPACKALVVPEPGRAKDLPFTCTNCGEVFSPDSMADIGLAGS